MLIWLISKRITRLCGSSPELVWLLVSKLKQAHGSMADVEVLAGVGTVSDIAAAEWKDHAAPRDEWWRVFVFSAVRTPHSWAGSNRTTQEHMCALTLQYCCANCHVHYVCLCHSPREFCVMFKTALLLLLTVCLFLVQFTRSAIPLVWTIVTVEPKWVKHK